jgi:aminopeptidase
MLGGRNESGLHWDMICDLRADGEVYADGELVWKAGKFLHEPRAVAEREPVTAS